MLTEKEILRELNELYPSDRWELEKNNSRFFYNEHLYSKPFYDESTNMIFIRWRISKDILRAFGIVHKTTTLKEFRRNITYYLSCMELIRIKCLLQKL